MRDITIHNVDEAVVQRIAALAAQDGVGWEEYVRQGPSDLSAGTPREAMAKLAASRGRSRRASGPDDAALALVHAGRRRAP